MLGIQIQECVKRITYHQHVGFILERQDYFSIRKPIIQVTTRIEKERKVM